MRAIKSSRESAVEWVVKIGVFAYLFWKELHTERPQIVAPKLPAISNAAPGAIDSSDKAGNAKKTDHDQDRDTARTEIKEAPYWKAMWRLAVSAAKEWSAHRAASKGAALALYTLFSLAPMLVLIVTIAGFFLGDDVVRASLVEQMSGLMGDEGADAIKTMLGGGKSDDSGWIAGLISAVLVLVSATSAFAELKDSLDELWEVPASTESGLWSIIRQRFLSFGLILVLVLMLLASLGVSAALAALGNLWGDSGEDSPYRIVSLILTNIASFAVLVGLFAAIFKYLPAVKIAWRDVLVGAVLTALLFSLGKFAIGTYIGHADISSSYGAAGSIVILITWIFYSAQIFFYGSLFTHEYALTRGSRAKPADELAAT